MIKICIFYNEAKDKAVKIFDDCKKYFKKKKVKILSQDEVNLADFVVVIGGDGTLLRYFRTINEKCQELPMVVAINAGSMGYLTEVTEADYKKIFDRLLNDFDYVKNNLVEERYILEVNIGRKKYYSLNEVVIIRKDVKTNVVNTKITVNEKELAEFKGDGVIIATPTGSTAYSLSVGGPIIIPSLKLFLVSPIAPHNLNTRPIILDGSEKINLSIFEPTEKACINIDGQHIKIIDKNTGVNIKYSDRKLKLVIPEDRNYFEVLKNKLRWGGNLC